MRIVVQCFSQYGADLVHSRRVSLILKLFMRQFTGRLATLLLLKVNTQARSDPVNEIEIRRNHRSVVDSAIR